MRKRYDTYHDEFSALEIEHPGLTVRFKGSGSPDPPSSTLADTEVRKYARETLYPYVEQGLDGDGFGPNGFSFMRGQSLYAGLDKAYGRAREESGSKLARTIDPRDARVRNFVGSQLDRGYATEKDRISRQIRSEKVTDVDMAQALANEYLAGEKRMSVSAAGMYNQAVQQDMIRAQQYGTFGSNVASGVGSGAGSLYGAYRIDQRYNDLARKA